MSDLEKTERILKTDVVGNHENEATSRIYIDAAAEKSYGMFLLRLLPI
jgi:hypothetical protein